MNLCANQDKLVRPGEDGSFITYSEDITKKTDYDVIGGTENQIHLMPATGGERAHDSSNRQKAST